MASNPQSNKTTTTEQSTQINTTDIKPTDIKTTESLTANIDQDLQHTITIKTVNSVGRKKTTVITFTPNFNIDLKDLSKLLKKSLATGGSIKNETLSFSGDHSLAVFEFLKKRSEVKGKDVKFVVNGKEKV